MIQEEDAPAQKRNTGTMSTADKGARNPMAHLHTRIYTCGNGKVQIPAGTSEDLHGTVMITNCRTSCGGSPGLQMGSKPGMSR